MQRSLLKICQLKKVKFSTNYMHLHTTIDKKHKPNPWKWLVSEWLHVTCCIMSFSETTPLFFGPYPHPLLSPRCQVIKLTLKVAWMHTVPLKYNSRCNEIVARFLTLNSADDLPLGHVFQVTSSLVMAMVSCDHLRQWLTVLVSIED